MAVTTIPEALVRKAWAKDTWDTAMSTMFFSKFMGKSPNSIIQINEDLKFQSTHPRGVRLTVKGIAKQGATFQSTHPRGVRRYTKKFPQLKAHVTIIREPP